jgi:hypothetical protein
MIKQKSSDREGKCLLKDRMTCSRMENFPIQVEKQDWCGPDQVKWSLQYTVYRAFKKRNANIEYRIA